MSISSRSSRNTTRTRRWVEAPTVSRGVAPVPPEFTLWERVDVEAGERLLHSNGRAAVEAAYNARRKEPVDVAPPAAECGTPAEHQRSWLDWSAVRQTVQLAKLLGGGLPVKYYRPEGAKDIGRYRARVAVDMSCPGAAAGMPYVYMVREVRAVLAARWYWDVDVTN